MNPAAIHCWQPLLTSHQSHTLSELAKVTGLPVIVHVLRMEDAVRRSQGWSLPDLDGLLLDKLPDENVLVAARDRLRSSMADFHLFASPFEDARQIGILKHALDRKHRVWLISEPYPPGLTSYQGTPAISDRIKAWVRPALYRAYGRMLRGRVAGVFAISPLAVMQYRRMGLRNDEVFPFGYFVRPMAMPLPRAPLDRPLRALFLGTLIERKGLPDLIAASRLLRARGTPVSIDAWSPAGPETLPGDSGIINRGPALFGQGQAVAADYDILVLPSRHDGWGVVVNEALQAGTPVLCSSAVGAHGVVSRWGCGAIVPPCDPSALASSLEALASDPLRLAAMSSQASKVAPILHPKVAAAYLRDALFGGRPACPWYLA